MSRTSPAGWVVARESDDPARRSPRYYLVAATGPAQALALAEEQLGKTAKLSVQGPAEAKHLARRKMQLGDVVEIVSRNTPLHRP